MQSQVLEQAQASGLSIDAAAAEHLARFLTLLMRWNRVHNLTAVESVGELIRRHLLESLALRGFLRGSRIADMGSGAGLPGIPLAVTEPALQFTLIESRAKRVAFLRHVQGSLGLANVTIEHGRVEDLRDLAPFDTVLARAVAPLPEVVAMTRHLLGENGILLVPTKADFDGELDGIAADLRVRRIVGETTALLRGALVAVERTAQ
jgi:16S rRNA (guanine527-N7)-methyltransferase